MRAMRDTTGSKPIVESYVMCESAAENMLLRDVVLQSYNYIINSNGHCLL